jgi:hypothetical protein
METSDMQILRLRRQFFLSPMEIDIYPFWRKSYLYNQYILYVHPDLMFCELKRESKHLILLGEIYDTKDYMAGNEKIMESLILNNSIDELAKATYDLAGRYALIFMKEGNYYLLNDPSASRKVFFTTDLVKNWCGSQPHIIAKYSGIGESENPEVVNYYNSPEFRGRRKVNITDNTRYDNIKQLLPNRYLNLQTGTTTRFWPNKPLQRISLEEGVSTASAIIINIMKSFHHRHKLMIPVTSGNDSRVLLAASREISSDVHYYIIKFPGMSMNHRDIKVPRLLFKKLGLELHIHEFPPEVDKNFSEIYMSNSSFPLVENMAVIYNLYHKRFPDRVNLPGNFSDISRNFLSTWRKRIDAEVLAKIWRGSNMNYIVKNYETWLNSINPYNYKILDLFNWEERNGNWYNAYQEDKDIAQEDAIVFNSRLYMDVCLSVDPRYRDVDTNAFYRAMVKHMWPEALSENMYPKSWEKYYLKKLHVYNVVRRLTMQY